MVLEHIGHRQLQAYHHHVVRSFGKAVQTRRHFLDREGAFVGHLTRLDDDIGMRHAAAGQDETGRFFLVRQCLQLVRAVNHAAFYFFALAGTAGAVFAAVGQADAAADGGGQQRFVGIRGVGAAAGLHSDVKTHSRYPLDIALTSFLFHAAF